MGKPLPITCSFCNIPNVPERPGVYYVTNLGATICSECVEICRSVIQDVIRIDEKAARRAAFASGSLVALPVKRG